MKTLHIESYNVPAMASNYTIRVGGGMAGPCPRGLGVLLANFNQTHLHNMLCLRDTYLSEI